MSMCRALRPWVSGIRRCEYATPIAQTPAKTRAALGPKFYSSADNISGTRKCNAICVRLYKAEPKAMVGARR